MADKKHFTDMELSAAKGAFEVLESQQPEMLRLVNLLISGGQTPEQIFQEVTRRSPSNSIWPGLCAAAADWIIHQSKNS